MQSQARAGRMDAVAAHPLAELLACPPATGNLLNGAATSLDFDAGSVVFRQSDPCLGLYVAVSGRFLRRTERLETRLTSLHRERIVLRLKDHAEIARIRKEYGAFVRAWNTRQDLLAAE